jgi:hypothetical protein
MPSFDFRRDLFQLFFLQKMFFSNTATGVLQNFMVKNFVVRIRMCILKIYGGSWNNVQTKIDPELQHRLTTV